MPFVGEKQPRAFSDSEINRLAESLDSATDGEFAVAPLIACGERAIPVLRRILLLGPPKSVYVGRQRVVRVLSELGATSVLIEYLRTDREITDPILRLSEEAVESTASRELSRWRTDEVFQTLLQLVYKRPLPGAVEALGDFEKGEAVKPLIRWLEDDVARPFAIGSLTKLRTKAVDELIEAVRSPEPSRPSETRSSLLRRQAALGVLVAGNVTRHAWNQLRFLLYESDPLLLTRAAGIAIEVGAPEETPLATNILIQQLGCKDWFVVNESYQILLEHFDITCSAVEREITVRSGREDIESKKIVSLLRSLARKGEAA
jgi:predicted nucleic acid-binding protein